MARKSDLITSGYILEFICIQRGNIDVFSKYLCSALKKENKKNISFIT